jgi:hypothetical protein
MNTLGLFGLAQFRNLRSERFYGAMGQQRSGGTG